MMKTKKIIASVLALSLTVSAFAGCNSDTGSTAGETTLAQESAGNSDSADASDGSDSADTAAAADVSDAGTSDTAADVDFSELYGEDTIQLTVFSKLANYSGKITGWFGKILKDKFDCEVTIIPDTDGAFDTRMESGNLGDIVIFGDDGDNYTRAVNQGMLFDWNDEDILSEYGPYIKAHMPYALEKNAQLSNKINGSDTVYGFGHDVATSPEDHQSFMYTWDLRWDLYKQLGCPDVKNLDDYLKLMSDMKELCPTDDNGNPTYAVSLWPDWDGSMVMYVKAFASAYWGYDELALGLYDVNNGEYHYALESDGPYLEALKFFNQLYQNDLLDPNSMTQTYDQCREKVVNGGTFFSIFNYAGSDFYNTNEHKEENKMMLAMAPDEATPIAYGMNIRGADRIWAIGANTEYPELCMAIINYLATPEGFMTYKYGPKDACWYYDDEGNACLTELGEECFASQDTVMPDELGGATFKDGVFAANNTTWSVDAVNPDSNGDTYNAKYWKSRAEKASCDIEQEWRDFTGSTSANEYLDNRGKYTVAIGGSNYTAGTRSDDLELIWKQVTECVVTYSWKAMYASSDDEFNSLVDEMVNMCNEYDPDGLCKQWSENEAAARFAAEEEVRNNG